MVAFFRNKAFFRQQKGLLPTKYNLVFFRKPLLGIGKIALFFSEMMSDSHQNFQQVSQK